MTSQIPQSPEEAKKKKVALPSLLSNIRNAQGTIGRAADDFHEREIRPLLGVGGPGGSGAGVGSSSTSSGRIAAPSSHPQLHRSAPSASLAATFNNFSQRFGDQWRKRSTRRKKGQGVTNVPQSFFIAVGCFFFAFPVFFLLYILARHAVFGDEEDMSRGKQVHIHEVPTSFGRGETLLGEQGGANINDNPQKVPESPIIVHDDTVMSELQEDVKNVVLGEGDSEQKAETETLVDDNEYPPAIEPKAGEQAPAGVSAKEADTITNEEKKEIESSLTGVNEDGNGNPREVIAKASNEDAESVEQESTKTKPQTDQVEEKDVVDSSVEKEASLRGSHDDEKKK